MQQYVLRLGFFDAFHNPFLSNMHGTLMNVVLSIHMHKHVTFPMQTMPKFPACFLHEQANHHIHHITISLSLSFVAKGKETVIYSLNKMLIQMQPSVHTNFDRDIGSGYVSIKLNSVGEKKIIIHYHYSQSTVLRTRKYTH